MADAVGENQGPQTRQLAVAIDGTHTDILCTWFSDRIMVVVTQYRKFGTLINVKKESTVSRDLSSNQPLNNEPVFNTKVLMGKDEPVWHVYGRQIASIIGEKDESNRQVLLAIALKKHSPEILHCIMDQIQELKTSSLVK
ncbi:proteasome assembly chaperone 3-like [Actinia tenebrosa]|uniref:Proteasome assembly chaperone 3-like n=1 Tax=Actinia tenebrosa TaxID=6105 RepID=A0A6P8H543_ACTTE|nr:proteasome assembly chaperone 3-like [Actinia tenebrosa]